MDSETMKRDRALCFRMLADPTRLGIIDILANSEATVTEIAEMFKDQVGKAAVSMSLAKLRDGGFVDYRVISTESEPFKRSHRYYLTGNGRKLAGVSSHLLEQNFDRFNI